MTHNERMDLGRDAIALSENKAFTTATERLRSGIYERMRACSLRDPEGLAVLHQQLKVVDAFEAAMSQLVEDGKLAAHEWEKLDAARTDGPISRTLRRFT